MSIPVNLLEAVVRAPLAKSLGWSLIHFLWEGTAIALLLAVVLFLCGPGPARLRYGLCCLALAAMPVVFGVTLAVTLNVPPVSPTAAPPAAPPAAEDTPRMITPTPKPWTGRLKETLPWVVPFWMAGVVVFYLRSVAGWIAVRNLRRCGVCAAPAEWQERLHRLRQRIRISDPVILLESCLVDVPVVVGLLRPAILMPLGLLVALPVEQLELILLHELAHIRRRDYLVNVLQSFVEGLLFYHPAVWWVSRLVRTERENCCDDAVVQLNGDARRYAAALAKLETSRWAVRQPALAANGGKLMGRIRRLIEGPERQRTSTAPIFAAGVLLLSLGVAVGWQTNPAKPPEPPSTNPPAVTAPAPEERVTSKMHAQAGRVTKKQGPPVAEDATQELETPYRKWMISDVAYIITDAERIAFKVLRTDAEREHFIEQFWLRRDPTPRSVENEYKEEHYRRIAYANERYASGIPGWKTDRGRIYITYGPPDEIESHPSGGNYRRPDEQGGGTTVTYPFEQWRYRHIEGVGDNVIIEFVDPERTGEFRMTMDPNEKDATLNLPRDPEVASSRTRAGATVQPMAAGAALISIPLSAYGNHAVQVSVRVQTGLRRPVTNFQDTIQGPAPIYTRFVSLAKGTYRVVVIVKDTTSGTLATDDLSFDVK